MAEESKIVEHPKKEPRPLGNELRALLLGILFLVLGILVLLAVKLWINDRAATTGDAVLVALLVIPILVYTIISGRLQDFKGPGGMELRFNQVAAAPVDNTTARDPLSVNEDKAQFLTKGEGERLDEQLKVINEDHPIILKLTFGKQHAGGIGYSIADLAAYVEELFRFRSFKLIVFADGIDRFVACMAPLTIKRILSTDKQNNNFTTAINNGDKSLFDYPGVVRKRVSISSSNAEALRVMADNNLEAVVVTDENDQLKWIAERQQVLSRMVLALTPDT
jgi:hypothetical protein